MDISTRQNSRRWMWIVAAVIVLGEFLLFDLMTSKHHASVYPRWSDQIQYLSESYQTYEYMQNHGVADGLKFSLSKPAIQGTLHDFFASLIFYVAGSASRSAALSLNMLVFIAWQLVTLGVISKITGSRALGWIGFGLLLCLAWPWSGETASTVDFRLDHGAMCLFGITGTLALLTNGFRSLGWSLVFGAGVAITLLERFITGAYFAPIFLVSALWILAGDQRGLRLRNLVMAGLTAGILAGPVFWFNRTMIYTYYWVGHISGAEGDARVLGLNTWTSVKFVFANLYRMHLGAEFGLLVAAFTFALGLLAIIARRKGVAPRAQTDWGLLAAAFLIVPAIVLSLHRQKSEFVLGILAPGVILLVLWLWHLLWRNIDFRPVARWRQLLPATLAGVILVIGGNNFISRQLWQPHSDQFIDDAQRLNQIADYIYTTARAANISKPGIGVDQVVDFLHAQVLQVITYERHDVWVPFVIHLPQGILTESDELIMYRLKLCDFVLLTDEMEGDGHWPYDQQMRGLYPELKAWCETNLHYVKTYPMFGRQISLYQKPPLLESTQ